MENAIIRYLVVALIMGGILIVAYLLVKLDERSQKNINERKNDSKPYD